MRTKLLITGLTRNSESSLTKRIQDLSVAFKDFEISWFLVESNSSDKTPQLLESLSRQKVNFSFLTLGNFKSEMNRVERLRLLRNYYCGYVSKRKNEFDWVLIVDFDLKLRLKHAEELTQSILDSSGDEKKIVTLNPSFAYDVFSLRCEGWLNADYRFNNSGRELSRYDPRRIYRMATCQIPPSNTRSLNVTSYFGGLLVARPEIFSGDDYSQEVLFTGECEHVSFFRHTREYGDLTVILSPIVKEPLCHSFIAKFFFMPWVSRGRRP